MSKFQIIIDCETEHGARHFCDGRSALGVVLVTDTSAGGENFTMDRSDLEASMPPLGEPS